MTRVQRAGFKQRTSQRHRGRLGMTNPNPRNLGAPQGPGFLVIKSSNGKYLSPSPLLLVLGLTFIRVLFLLYSTFCFLFLLKLLLFVFLFVLCVLTAFLFLLPSSVIINIIIPFTSTLCHVFTFRQL